jgi:hypothetical protein
MMQWTGPDPQLSVAAALGLFWALVFVGLGWPPR